MTRRERMTLLRLVILASGLLCGGLFLVAPLWSRAGEAAAERRALAADEARLAAEWTDFATTLAARGVTGPLNAVALPDSLLARLLLERPLPPPGGLRRGTDVLPAFLTELGQVGLDHDIEWTGAKSLGGELQTVSLLNGEQLPIQVAHWEMSGHGTFAAIGRALRALHHGAVPVRVRAVQIRAAEDDAVDVTLTLDLFGAP